MAASAANVRKGARYERPVVRNRMYPLYTADALKRGVVHIKKSAFFALMSSTEFVDKTAETCCCGT